MVEITVSNSIFDGKFFPIVEQKENGNVMTQCEECKSLLEGDRTSNFVGHF